MHATVAGSERMYMRSRLSDFGIDVMVETGAVVRDLTYDIE